MSQLKDISSLLEALFPICRSLTGNGNRKTFNILKEHIDLELHEVPSGTSVFDWTIPEEWNVSEAWLKDEDGNTILNFKDCNVHLLNYSSAIDEWMSFDELSKNLFFLEDFPDAIPYRTSYYKKRWGFCLSYNQFKTLDKSKKYHAYIDSTFDSKGSLTYATAFKKGKSDKEILLSSYCCHPSLANDNLSGMIGSALLFKHLSNIDTYYSYRLVIAPETIGVITFLAQNQDLLKNIIGGTVMTTIAGPGKIGLKASYDEVCEVQKAAEYVLNNNVEQWKSYPFTPDGSDERQYCTPGIRIPTVTICKDKYYEYKEYHTSKDNLDFVRPEQLNETLDIYKMWIDVLEMNRSYERFEPSCEYQLGKRGLYPQTGGQNNQQVAKDEEQHFEFSTIAMNWLMFGCDGKTSLLDLALRSGLDLKVLYQHAQKFLGKNLLEIKE